MNTPSKLAAFALGLTVVLGGAAGLGHAVGPIAGTGPTGSPAAMSMGGHAGHDEQAGQKGEETPGGLMISQHGYTLEPTTRTLRAGQQQDLSFVVRGPDGHPVTAYKPTHDRDLHLIIARRDLTDYQHLHPTLDAAGTWHLPLTLPTAGEYRMFADFATSAPEQSLVLGADLAVAGEYAPQPLPAPAATAQIDGYSVTLDGRLEAGRTSKLTLTVSRNGRPVTDLQPYLAAYGHLVALRDGDLAYLHVHPDGGPGDGHTAAGPGITFYATVPAGGEYRLFLDFKHGDTVHTAAFTAHAEQPSGTEAPAAADQGHQH